MCEVISPVQMRSRKASADRKHHVKADPKYERAQCDHVVSTPNNARVGVDHVVHLAFALTKNGGGGIQRAEN